jgi:hypothetical protein
MKSVRWLSVACACSPAMVAAPASARTEIHPYIQAQQVFDWDMSNGDTGNFTGVGAGIDLTVDQRKLKAQLDYQYNHYFAWENRYPDSDVHTGLATGTYQWTPEFSLNAAGIAARTRGSLAAPSSGLLAGDIANTQQVYGAQAGPTYNGRVGAFTVNGNYRFGWSHADYGGNIDLGPGQPILDNDYTDTSHTVTGSIGMRPRELGLPFGWAVKGGYIRDDIHRLDSLYEGKFVRGDLTVPLSPTLAAVGGAGYEWNDIKQRPLLTDAAGNAVLDDRRRLQADKSQPRQLLYDQDGLLWDVGVLWQPSQRLSLELRGGRRYGEWAVTGNLQWKPSRYSTVQVVAYNDITSFGRQLTSGLGALGTGFVSPIGSAPVGCVFGQDGGAGGCNPALSSINGNFYRSRGVYGIYSVQSGRWTYGLAANYDHRRYLASDTTGTTAGSFAGVTDETVTVNGIVSRQLSANSTLSGNAYVAWYDTSFQNSPSYTVYGVTGAYTRNFGRHITGQASISVYSGTSSGDFDQDTVGQAMVGVRYTL